MLFLFTKAISDCYAKAYRDECARRGLAMVDSTAKALALWDSPKNRALFTATKVLTEKELVAQSKACIRFYCKSMEIEAKTCLDMARSLILPAALKYSHLYFFFYCSRHQANVAESAASARNLVGSSIIEPQKQLVSSIATTVSALVTANAQLDVSINSVTYLYARLINLARLLSFRV